jgi:acetylornithine deacetylase
MALIQTVPGFAFRDAAAPPDTGRPSARTLEILHTLVGFDTVSRNSNLGLIEWVRDELARLGVASRLSWDADRRKANLFATLGDGRAPGIVLSGHTDVVPVDGQDWHSDPFKVTERDGKLFGRGTADMKGYIASALAAAPAILQANLPSAVHFAFSYDEEVGCFGVHELIKDLREAGIQPAGCIVGEPTLMQPVVSHKGTWRLRCCFRGREAHSAMPTHGVNAVEYAAQLVVFMREVAARFVREEPRDEGFPVPFSTIQTTTIAGGTAQNIVPNLCELTVDLRTMPGTSFDALHAQIRAFAAQLDAQMKHESPETGCEVEFLAGVPAFVVEDTAPIVNYARRLARTQGAGKVTFGTEAGIFSEAGIPTVIIGPGSIDDAHRPDEFVSLQQLADCDTFMQRLIESKFDWR